MCVCVYDAGAEFNMIIISGWNVWIINAVFGKVIGNNKSVYVYWLWVTQLHHITPYRIVYISIKWFVCVCDVRLSYPIKHTHINDHFIRTKCFGCWMLFECSFIRGMCYLMKNKTITTKKICVCVFLCVCVYESSDEIGFGMRFAVCQSKLFGCKTKTQSMP